MTIMFKNEIESLKKLQTEVKLEMINLGGQTKTSPVDHKIWKNSMS